MTRNKSYLLDYEEIDGGFVAFRGSTKGGKITDKGKIRTVLLRVPRKNNMYIVDLKNVAPSGGLTCLFAKATLDESNLWHRRLGHINFKTMNKLVKGNLVRGIENQINHRVKIIRCDNGTEFKNKEMNQFCEMKWIKREFSVARTPQQNGVAERKNRTLIEAVRNMLADSKKPALSFMRPFGCPVTILNTLDHLGKARVETVPGKNYILLSFLTQDLPLSSSSKDSPDARFKPSGKEENKDAKHLENKDNEVPNTEELRVNQEQDENANKTNNINIVSSNVNTASIEDNAVDENTVYGCADDPNMPNLEKIVYSEDDEGVGAEAYMNNLDTFMPVSPIPTTIIHKDHPFE
ncbi:ribonuclease H-like domain-containing protein [Tanacetum coccineum]